jgi:hypothetical protein
MDWCLKEIWSYLLYKKGKEPLSDIDPRSRIKKGIWIEEGVDMTAYASLAGVKNIPEDLDIVMDLSTVTVREGFLRKKRDHFVASGLKDLSLSGGSFEKDGWSRDRIQSIFLRSDILHPFSLNRAFGCMDSAIASVKVERRPQRDALDLNPDRVLHRTEVHLSGLNGGEDVKKLYGRKSDRKKGFRTPSGREIRDLPSLIEHVFSCSEEELLASMEKGSFQEFASEGLSSPLLESLFGDLMTDPSGTMERPDGFRIRFGRWILEGPFGDDVTDKIVPKLLGRLVNCPEGEASKIEDALKGLIDPRSTSNLTSLVFSAHYVIRPHIIRLLGLTRDRAALDTLRRLMEFSTVDTDKDSAREALASMGFDPREP